jgi:outer membrane lipoprotein-sorting protein
MSLLRRMPLPRLVALCVGLVLLGASATALAGTLASGPTPPPRSLPEAVHGALAASPVSGVSANITLTNHLIEAGSLEGPSSDGGPSSPNPLLAGGSGRLWIADNGKARLELQSEQGDTEIIYDGSTLTIYDAASDSLYRVKLPAAQAGAGASGSGTSGTQEVPSVQTIEDALAKLAGHVELSGAIPGDVAGQAAYAVRLSPAHNGGLLGSMELAWDANHGVPLKLAVYATSSATSPVLELKATGIEYGPVSESTFHLEPPASVKVTEVDLAEAQSQGGTAGSPAGAGSAANGGEPVTGPTAVAAALPFTLAAPSEVDGIARSQVVLVHLGDKPAAVITYGQGLGAIRVIESQAESSSPAGQPGTGAGEPGESALANLPHVSINGSSATELPTALGTILSFQRHGVSYVVAGSITPATARAAAKGL